MKIHLGKRVLSLFLILCLVLALVPTALAAGAEARSTAVTVVDSKTLWNYYDYEEDPVLGTDAYAQYPLIKLWAYGAFLLDSESGWKWGTGSFGAKNGKIADLGGGCTPNTLLNQYKENGDDIEAYFFVTTFDVSDEQLAQTKQVIGSLYYDDSAIVYLNNSVVASFDAPDDAFTANMVYGGSNASAPKLGEFTLTDNSALKSGTNVLAVEIHQGRASSSDIYFDFVSLQLSSEAPDLDLPFEQDTATVSLGADETQMNFSWYATTEEAGTITYAPESSLADGAMPATALTMTADVAETNRGGYYSNQATLENLEPNTTYAYQLTNTKEDKTITSEIRTFTTGGGEQTNFLFVGDPQLGSSGNLTSDTNGWETTLTNAMKAFPNATFLLSAGDQVDAAGSEQQYQAYLNRDAFSSLPQVTTIGNHDSTSSSYGQHFNVANESAEYGVTDAGGDSYFVYNHILFMTLNSNDMSDAEHKAFMEQAIAATAGQNIQWKIVVFHHSVFSVASHAVDSDILTRRETLVPIFKELDIDVVLMGHDHVYCRSYMMDGAEAMTDPSIYDDANYSSITNPTGILYVTANSASGSKYYDIKTNLAFPYAAVMNQEKTPNVSYVEVTDTSFTITTYRASDMSVVDTFTIYRTAESEEPQTGYQVTFNADHATVDVYYTQNYTAADETDVTKAYARDSDTGAIDIGGDGQVNFKVTVDEGYELASISADKNYKNLKDSADTKVEGIYRLTKITGDVTVTITTKSTGSGEPAEPEDPTYTPVVTADTRVTGYYDATGSLKLELAGRYNSGAMNADGGSLEIVAYNPVNGYAYAVSGVKGKLIAVDLNGSLDGDTVVELSGTEYDVKALVRGFTYGDMTSVAVSPDGTKLAVAIQAENYADNGVVALFACNSDGSLELLSTVSVGVQPDMVTFADNSTILSADEGEPRNGANAADPKGSVSIVTIGADNALTANTVTFDSFDNQRSALTAAGVLIQKNTNPSTDFEPEYIAVSGSTAYVSLQEANAVAVLDISAAAFTGVYPLGFQDYGVTQVDLQKNDAIELKNYENVYGIKMPDGIAVTTIGGRTYLLTANEGDSRADWDGLDNEYESKISPTGNVTLDNKVVWFNAEMWDGLDTSKAYVFGGRSFSIYEVTAAGLNLVYDSGSGFEEITAAQLAGYFNASNDKTSLDNRSGKKGPEPESVVTGVVNGRTYAFIALERIGGVMVYDISDPARTEFVNYINSREFENPIRGDVSPEGLCFVSARDSKTGKPLLLTACEVSGTLAVYELTGTVKEAEENEPQKPGAGAGSSSGTGSATATKPSTGFVDVRPGDYYNDAVLWAVEQGITTGTTAVTFSPADGCTRAQAVTFLWRAMGCPEPAGAVNPFTDVSKTAYYYKAVLWAVEQGITTGTSETAFSPDAVCTRAQIVTFLWRLDGTKAGNGANPFTDVAKDAYYYDAVLWAVAEDVTSGTSAAAFSPDAACTRAQIVTFLYRDLA